MPLAHLGCPAVEKQKAHQGEKLTNAAPLQAARFFRLTVCVTLSIKYSAEGVGTGPALGRSSPQRSPPQDRHHQGTAQTLFRCLPSCLLGLSTLTPRSYTHFALPASLAASLDGDDLNPRRAGCPPEGYHCAGAREAIAHPWWGRGHGSSRSPSPCHPEKKKTAQQKCTAIAFAYFLSLFSRIAAPLCYRSIHAIGFPAAFSRDFFFFFLSTHCPQPCGSVFGVCLALKCLLRVKCCFCQLSMQLQHTWKRHGDCCEQFPIGRTRGRSVIFSGNTQT